MTNKIFGTKIISKDMYGYRGHIVWQNKSNWQFQGFKRCFQTLEDAKNWLDERLAIKQIEQTYHYNALMTIEQELFANGQPSEAILAALEKRQNELYTLTDKDIAEAELDEGLQLQNENINRGWKAAYILQAKRNSDLWVKYNEA